MSIGSAVFAQLTAERPVLSIGPPLSPLKIAHAHGDLDLGPIKYMVPWTHWSPKPKQHLDHFSGFCKAHDRDRQTTLLGL